MSNLVDHPNRPSVLLRRWVGDLHNQARAAEQNGFHPQACHLRATARHAHEIADTTETHYETKVSDLIAACQDVLDGGGFAGSLDAALIELARCVTALRTKTGRHAA